MIDRESAIRIELFRNISVCVCRIPIVCSDVNVPADISRVRVCARGMTVKMKMERMNNIITPAKTHAPMVSTVRN